MKKLRTVLALTLTLLLSGCSLFSFEEAELMAPPKATGAKAQIQELIEEQTSQSYTLVYPKFGSNRSSIVTHDIDYDNEEEAVAFYTDKNGEDVHALFLECEEGEYSVVSDMIYDGNGVDRIEFADINNDHVDEILIGYTSKTSSLNTLSVYTYGKKISQFDETYQYSSLVTGDFNADERDDVLLVSLYSGDISASAKLMVYNNNGALSEISSVELDSDITQLASIQYGKLSIDSFGAVLDGVSSSGDYTTQVVIFNTKRYELLNPLYSYSGYSNTRRSTQVCSMDINGDQIIDIPLCSLMGYAQGEDTETVCRRIDWSDFNSNTYSLATCLSTIICPIDGYTITIPEKWNTAITARYNKQTHETTVYVYEYVKETLKITDELLTIKAFTNDSFDKDSGFIELLNTGATTYAYRINDTGNYMSITGEEVVSMFTLVNQ